jgi:hypothetical protein
MLQMSLTSSQSECQLEKPRLHLSWFYQQSQSLSTCLVSWISKGHPEDWPMKERSKKWIVINIQKGVFEWLQSLQNGVAMIHTMWLWGEIDTPHSSCGIICFTFYALFCKGLEMMGSDKICTASCTYVHVLSLCVISNLYCIITVFHRALASCCSRKIE